MATRARLRPGLLAVGILVAGAQLGHSQAEVKVDFRNQIQPILSANCYECHGPDEESREAGLRLDKKESAFADLGGYANISPGDPEDSELYIRISAEFAEERMPPDGVGPGLTAGQIGLIRLWIEQGARWDE